jgi:hypothetical protein
MSDDDLVRAVVRSSLIRYLAEAVLVGAAAVVVVVMGISRGKLVEAGALALRSDGRAVRALAGDAEHVRSLGWAYLVRRGGPIGPWAGMVQLRFVDGGKLRVHTSRARAEALIDMIGRRVPGVELGYTVEAERAFKARRAAG